MQHRAPQRQPLFPADGQGTRGSLLAAFQPCHVQRPGQALGKNFGGNAVQPGKKAEILDNLQVVVEGKFLRHVANLLPHCFRLLGDVNPRYPCVPGSGKEQAAEYTDGRGFARAVGAQEAEDLATMRPEADAVHRDKVSEALSQVFDHYGGFASIHIGFASPAVSGSLSTADTNRSSIVAPTGWMES